MMGTFSTSLKNTALSLLTTYGQQVTFTRHVTSEYNVNTGSVDSVSTTTYTCYVHPSSYNLSEIDGQTIQLNDVALIVYSTTEPLIQDEASIDNIIYKVLAVEKVKAQGEAIIYRLQLRV
jgi:hypothetical protein